MEFCCDAVELPVDFVLALDFLVDVVLFFVLVDCLGIIGNFDD